MSRLYIYLLSVLFAVSCGQHNPYSISSHRLIAIDTTLVDDTSVNAFIAPYRDTLENMMNRIIGFNLKTMKSEKPNSLLSGFVADIMLEEGNSFIASLDISDVQRPAFAIVNVRGLRSNLNAGEISVRNIFEIMPFENMLTAVLMKGNDVDSLFRHIASIDGDGLAGASFTMTDAGAQNIRIDNKPLNSNELYWIFAPDYLADGGDHYFVFNKAVEKIYSRLKLRDLIIKHIEELTKQGKQLNPTCRVRIADTRTSAN